MSADVMLVGEVLAHGEWRFASLFPDDAAAAQWLRLAKRQERRVREFRLTRDVTATLLTGEKQGKPPQRGSN